jgi:ABC-type sugar transport system ATPase subunit
MLDVTLRNIGFRYPSGFALREVSVTFAGSTHTAVAGPPACGASTLLQLIAGTLRPHTGDILIGQRIANDVKASRRPLLFVTSMLDIPLRWSVQHALVAAVRTRNLDREDRHHEYALAATKWELGPLFERRLSSLSSTERARVQCARIELLRPAILLADRMLEGVNPSALRTLADTLHRTLRVHGTTVISVPSSREELATSDRVVVLGGGTIVQSGSAAELFSRPADEAAAVAIGDADAIPVTIRGKTVESVIGSWDVDDPPFQGPGVAIVRPAQFVPARPGEDSDLIFGVEEAGFAGGRWVARGMLTGGLNLRVELPAGFAVHKGRVMALRYDPAGFTLIARPRGAEELPNPSNAVPPMSETR